MANPIEKLVGSALGVLMSAVIGRRRLVAVRAMRAAKRAAGEAADEAAERDQHRRVDP